MKRREETQQKIKQELIDPLSAAVATAATGGMTIHSPLHHTQNSATASLHGGMPLI